MEFCAPHKGSSYGFLKFAAPVNIARIQFIKAPVPLTGFEQPNPPLSILYTLRLR